MLLLTNTHRGLYDPALLFSLTVVDGLCSWIDRLWLCDGCGLRFGYGDGNSDDCVLLLRDSSVLMGRFWKFYVSCLQVFYGEFSVVRAFQRMCVQVFIYILG